jgi:hypothetical protein
MKKNKRSDFYLHRLVGQAFIPTPNDLPLINHKDRYRSNNNIIIIELRTQEYNMRSNNTVKPIGCVNKSGNGFRV